jgi:hypothetical protein
MVMSRSISSLDNFSFEGTCSHIMQAIHLCDTWKFPVAGGSQLSIWHLQD